MKKSFTKLLGALLCAFMLVPSSVSAQITATWDFKEKNPSGIENVSIQGTTGFVASSTSGVKLFVNAASGKFAASYSGETYNKYVQINDNTSIQIPVVSTKDVVTISIYYKGADYTLGGEDNVTSHTATAADVAHGYVLLDIPNVEGTPALYLNSISVSLAYMPATAKQATWDFSKGGSLESTILGFSGTNTNQTIEVNGIALTVNANGKSFGYDGANRFYTYNGASFRVPVISTEDVITVNSYSTAGSANYSISGSWYTALSTEYTATSIDVTNGYIEIINGKDSYSFLQSISVKYKSHTSATIGSTGWATFSNTAATDFTNLAGVVDAYQVTGNSEKAITKSAVTTAAANTGLLLNAEEGTYAIPLAATGADLSGTNKLVAVATSTSVGAAESGYTNYVLVASGTSAVFQYISGTNATVAAGKAYLKLNISAPASRELLAIDGDATGIQNIKVGTEDNVYYDLQGRRVLYPKKGLYIVNGKKVILK